MKVIRKLDLEDHPWLRAKPLTKLLNILNSDGINARMVGGCVRDALLGRQILDIDLACSLTPEAVVGRLEKAGVKVIPTGLKHGTVTAVIAHNNFEITSLRQDVETYGRHAKVAFTDDWLEDAKRRDFTFNALYLDGDGSLYDPCDGLKDLAERRVLFIGDAAKRIQEDALRILRFFRFAAQIGQGNLDTAGLEACIRHKDLIDNLSGERLAQEIFKMLKAENLLPILKVMADCGILDKVLPDHKELEELNNFVRLEQRLGRCDSLARLSCLLQRDQNAVVRTCRHLKLSNRQMKILSQYAETEITISAEASEKDIRKAIYHFGRDVVIFALLQHWAKNSSQDYGNLISYSENWATPVFPVRGRDLIQAGSNGGPQLGRALKHLESAWVASDFSLTKTELLSINTEG